jgi:hypothetical protein
MHRVRDDYRRTLAVGFNPRVLVLQLVEAAVSHRRLVWLVDRSIGGVAGSLRRSAGSAQWSTSPA